MPYAEVQLSPCATTPESALRAWELQLLSLCASRTEAHVPRAHAPHEKPLQWEACPPQLESNSCLPQLENTYTQQWRLSTAKNFKKLKKKKKDWTSWSYVLSSGIKYMGRLWNILLTKDHNVLSTKCQLWFLVGQLLLLGVVQPSSVLHMTNKNKPVSDKPALFVFYF